MAITKKLRFEVFKRDGFTCQYCGRTPPDVTLEIDHINPKSKNGKDDINNLITSCFDCNRGKSNIPLEKAPMSLKGKAKIIQERELQLREYNKLLAKIEKRLSREAEKINNIFQEYFPSRILTETFLLKTVKKFLKLLTFFEVAEAMRLACVKMSGNVKPCDDADRASAATKYFCGICWGIIKSQSDPLYKIKNELKYYWKTQPRGSGYLKKGILDIWLQKYSVDTIKSAMNEAKGLWEILYDKLGD